ncbi:MAG: response regulator [Brevundimonas sp.]|nr:MAG: response regulator [Brevundimonas sp.]
MSQSLLLIAVAMAGALLGLSSAVRSGVEARRLKTLNATLESRIVVRTAELRQALDAASARSLDLAAANQARSDMLAAMNHELRTPLNAVIGFSELLALSTADHPLTRRQVQAIEQIHVAGARLLRLVDHVLAFADVESGPASIEPERVDPLLVVRQAIDAHEREALEADVELLAPAPAGGFTLDADPARLRQIVSNLISNAIRHNRTGGAALVEVRQTRDGTAISVRDTGPGIQPDRLARIFVPERRGDAGVSLAVSKRLAEAMGGSLTAESKPGEGACFTLTLPGEATVTRAASVLPEPTADLSTATLLYIDDHAANRILMRHVMSALGPELHVAETGEAGLALARDLRPDIILLDINLPDLDGFAIKARLDADPLTRGLPVVAFTAAADPADARRGRQAGFAGWLTKPLDIALMSRTLVRVLALARPANAA